QSSSAPHLTTQPSARPDRSHRPFKPTAIRIKDGNSRIARTRAMNAPAQIVPPYRHTPLFPLGKDTTPYRKLTSEGVRVGKVMGKAVVVVSGDALRTLAEAAFVDINHLLRPGHLKQLAAILADPEASDNDKFVAYDFLKNANIAAGGVLPMCQ